MQYTEIEGLSENKILELYQDILETSENEMTGWASTYWYCLLYCDCTDNTTRIAYAYSDVNNAPNSYSNSPNCINGNNGWNISGGCSSLKRAYFVNCRITAYL